MWRRSFLFAAFLQAAESDDLRYRALAFETHWNLFIRRLFGCADTGEVSSETCKPHAARIDRREFENARDAAKKLFELKDK